VAKILFKPTCSFCGKVLPGIIDCVREEKVCGVSLWADTICPVRYEEGNE